MRRFMRLEALFKVIPVLFALWIWSDSGADPRTCREDGKKNGAETDMDCGAICARKCSESRACLGGDDCESGVCHGGRCQMALCADGVQNGDETDKDCGGSCSNTSGRFPHFCEKGQKCHAGIDCRDGVCRESICFDPYGCTNHIRDGNETDVDCGGKDCEKCAFGRHCQRTDDCASGVCGGGGLCDLPTRTDGVQNGNETDVDCGENSDYRGQRCADGKKCRVNENCRNNSRCQKGICEPDPCHDGEWNGSESDVDCGGDCDKCHIEKRCEAPSDCGTGICNGYEYGYGKCAPTKSIFDNEGVKP